jgi:hypothetical protein
VGRDGSGYTADLGILKIRIFLQKGLDRIEVICASGSGASSNSLNSLARPIDLARIGSIICDFISAD